MNNRHRNTLQAVFAVPTKSNIVWADIEALLLAVDCKLVEGSGSIISGEFSSPTVHTRKKKPSNTS
jgi:hypothetical protein